MDKETKFVYGNCYFASFYLFLRGTVKKLIGVKSTSRLWPYHFLTLTKNDHIIHFKYIHPHEENNFAPFWFEGRFVGLKKSKMNKEIKFTIENQYAIFAIFLSIWLTLVIPWVIVSGLYTACWSIRWGIKAIILRFFGKNLW